MEDWQKLSVSAFGARRVWVEQVSLFQRGGNDAKSAFPRAVEEVESALHLLPMCQVEEGVADGLRVASLEDVLRRKDQRLHFQEVPMSKEREGSALQR